jgi:pimeloyl-ACP methyl ester carboxylesterase
VGVPGSKRGILQLTPGQALAWRSSGAEDDPTLLWLHNSTGSSCTAPALPGVRVVSYDRPGFGGSTFHSQRSLVTDVDDVEALLDHLDIGRTTIMAFSGGAAVGYAAAVRIPQRITRLGIVSGAPWPTGELPSAEVLRAAASALRADPRAVVDGLADGAPVRDARVLADPALREELFRGAVDAVATGVDGWIREAQLLRTRWPFRPSDVQAPVVMWHGSEDGTVTAEAASAVARALPSADLRMIADAGHLGWMLERAEIIRDLCAI